MELLVRCCLTLLGTYLSVSLLQYECVSTKFYLLISICFNQLLHIYVSWMYYHFLQNRVHMIRTIFASTESLILYFSRKPIVIHCFIENLKSQIAWNHGDDWSPHCGLCIFPAKLLSSNYTKKTFYCLKIILSTTTLSFKKILLVHFYTQHWLWIYISLNLQLLRNPSNFCLYYTSNHVTKTNIDFIKGSLAFFTKYYLIFIKTDFFCFLSFFKQNLTHLDITWVDVNL